MLCISQHDEVKKRKGISALVPRRKTDVGRASCFVGWLPCQEAWNFGEGRRREVGLLVEKVGRRLGRPGR